jgi:hypothetical protein
MLQSVNDVIVNPTLLFVSHEAWFHVSGFVNAPDTCYWDAENPYTIHEVPVLDQERERERECAGERTHARRWRIIGSLLFYNMVYLEHYMNSILELYFQMLTEEEKLYAYFQQDNSSLHITAFCGGHREIFSERFISQGLWQPCFPDLTVCDSICGET